jgi:hypothetical protein
MGVPRSLSGLTLGTCTKLLLRCLIFAHELRAALIDFCVFSRAKAWHLLAFLPGIKFAKKIPDKRFLGCVEESQ